MLFIFRVASRVVELCGVHNVIVTSNGDRSMRPQQNSRSSSKGIKRGKTRTRSSVTENGQNSTSNNGGSIGAAASIRQIAVDTYSRYNDFYMRLPQLMCVDAKSTSLADVNKHCWNGTAYQRFDNIFNTSVYY